MQNTLRRLLLKRVCIMQFSKAVSLLSLLFLCNALAFSQELFVLTEPASNMPANSIGLRTSNWIMKDTRGGINYHLIPEVMWGINKNMMIHVEGFSSSRSKTFELEGAGLYAKYRLFSTDGLKKHFRIALFGRGSLNYADIHQQEIETNGHNSGIEFGSIFTGLVNRQAYSISLSFENASDNGRKYEFPSTEKAKAFNYSFSTGRLILPRVYAGYGQTNLNLIAEFIGQHLPGTNNMFLDGSFSVQLIFNSQTRLDIGYKRELYGNMARTAPNGMIIRLEHLLFNVFTRNKP